LFASSWYIFLTYIYDARSHLYQIPVIDVKVYMHCNIPWPRWDGSLGGVRCELWRHNSQRTPPRLLSHLGHGILQCIYTLTSITGFIPSQFMTKASGCYYSLEFSWRWTQRASETCTAFITK